MAISLKHSYEPPLSDSGEDEVSTNAWVAEHVLSAAENAFLVGTGTGVEEQDPTTALATLGAAALSHTHSAANITDFAEAVDDRVGALLTEGSNITLTYDDGAGTLTIAASGGGGGGVSDGDKGDITVSSSGATWTIDDAVPQTKQFMPAGTGATARTIQSKLRDVIYPEDYGAVGDGTTDDYTAFVNAMNAAGPGGIVRLKAKTYAIDTALQIPDGVLLEGEACSGYATSGVPIDGTVLLYTGSSTAKAFNFGAPNDGATLQYTGGGLRNIQFDGNYIPTIVLRIAAIRNAVFENLHIMRPIVGAGGKTLACVANTSAEGLENTIRNCWFNNISLFAYGAATAFFNQSNGTEGGLTGCEFHQMFASFGWGTGAGNGFYLSSMDDCHWYGIWPTRSPDGTGVAFYMDGNAGSGKVCAGNTFNMFHQAGGGAILADGTFSTENSMTGITGIDEVPTIIISNNASLYYEYLGTGYAGGGTGLSVTPPIDSYGTIKPVTNDVGALGSTSKGWSDLHLATGGVINFANGNYTLTHTSGVLTANGDFKISNAGNPIVDIRTSASGSGNFAGFVLKTGTYANAAQVIVKNAELVVGVQSVADWLAMDCATGRITLGGGLVLGSPTGGNKGAGTGNANGWYDDNTLLTCMAMATEFIDEGKVDIAKWDALVPDLIVPEKRDEVPVLFKTTITETVDVVEKQEDGRLVARKADVETTVERPFIYAEPVYNEDGEIVSAFEVPVTEEIITPAQTIVRTHRTARVFQTMLDTGFDPREPEQYFAKMRADEALPGMPNQKDWEHNALSLGDMHCRKWLAMEMLAIVCNVMWDKLKDHEDRLAKLEAA